MSRVIYFDGFSGVAGDMMLGALIDAGLPVEALRAALGSLSVGHELRVSRVLRSGLTATHVQVIDIGSSDAHSPIHPHTHSHDHRTLREIAHLIDHSSLSPSGKTRAVSLFQRLAEAEAAVHGVSVEDVHLHEVGALDSIIDIVGAVFALEWFGIDDIVSSPLNVGGGTVDIAHGRFPVPAPATVRLLGSTPVYSAGAQTELVTPTGALLVSAYAKQFGPMPAMTVDRVGYGAGTKELPHQPNVFRVMIGTRTASSGSTGSSGSTRAGDVVEIECEFDDMNPQLFGPLSDRLFAAGALDVFLTPVQMKKGRPGTLLTALAPPDARAALSDIVFRETTTLGVRWRAAHRETLDRRWEDVVIDGGVVRIKVATRNGEEMNAVPEFEDCLRIATATGRPLKAVQADAARAWLSRSAS